MNPKHQQFCDEYLSNGMIATQAYLSVYKSVKSEDVAAAASSRLLTNVKVKEYIAKQQQKSSAKLQVTREELIKDLMDIKNLHKDGNSAVAIKSIEVISKMLGFNEPEKIDQTINQVIKLRIPGMDDEDDSEE